MVSSDTRIRAVRIIERIIDHSGARNLSKKIEIRISHSFEAYSSSSMLVWIVLLLFHEVSFRVSLERTVARVISPEALAMVPLGIWLLHLVSTIRDMEVGAIVGLASMLSWWTFLAVVFAQEHGSLLNPATAMYSLTAAFVAGTLYERSIIYLRNERYKS